MGTDEDIVQLVRKMQVAMQEKNKAKEDQRAALDALGDAEVSLEFAHQELADLYRQLGDLIQGKTTSPHGDEFNEDTLALIGRAS